MPELVCVGNLTVDESVQPDGARTVAAGGDAVFAALAARLTLDDVTIVAPVGDDLPMELDEAIRLAGTDPGILPRRALPTVRNVVTYDADGGRDWVLLEGEAHFDAMSVYPADLSATALAADGILVSAMSFDSQVALGGWLRGNTAATIYLDLQEDYLERVDELLAIVALCDVFLPSEVEALALAGTRDLAEAARFFRGLGPQTVVIKRADKGCVVLAPGAGELVEVPAVPVAVVDTTGAGDAFCGAFAATHLLTGDPVAAAESGARAAALAVSGFGIAGLVDALTAVR
ncbi:MAG: PfkB domain protein [Microbacteriaceae bacterium]|nr:PfkB domain protein [Microbacteriaceae bacterium]